MTTLNLDWQLSAEVMAVSDRTREWIVNEAKRAEKEKVRARAIGRAVFDEIIDDRHATTVRRRITAVLGDRPMSRSDLRRAMGKQHYREAFDALLPTLEKLGEVILVPGDKAPHYALGAGFTGEPQFTPEKPSSGAVNPEFTGEPDNNVTDIDTRRSLENEASPRLTAREWFANHISSLQQQGHTTTTSFAVYSAGVAAGFTRNNLKQAASDHPDVRTIDRKGGTATWCIEPGANPAEYVGAPEWLDRWLDQQTDNILRPSDARIAGEAAGHPWHSVRRAAGMSSRVESVPAHGDAKNDRLWKVTVQAEEAGA